MDSGQNTEESRGRTKKGESYTPRKRNASDLNQKSVAEFFEKNKKIAGFDNPGKSLYSTVRELVENALHSAESIGKLPSVEVIIEELSSSKVKSMSGGIDEERLGKKLTGKGSFYSVRCKDNGRGLSEKDVINLFGQAYEDDAALSRKNRGVKQTCGKSGLGAKMAFMWSKLSAELPVEILSSTKKNQDHIEFWKLDIDIDMPNIHLHETRDNECKWRGTDIKVVIEGDWEGYGGKIVEYMRQKAFITPYAELSLRFVAATDTDKKVVRVREKRSTRVMPSVVVNPLAENLNLLMERLSESSNENLLEFLEDEFVGIGEEVATGLIGKVMGPDVTCKTQLNSLTVKQVVRMQKLFKEAAKISGGPIPIGAENLRLGIKKILKPDMFETCTKRGRVFVVEAAVCLGAEDELLEDGLYINRFANRVPLVFDEDSDVVATTAKKINWQAYKIYPETDKVNVYVNIASTKIPFKEAGIEFVDDIPEIADAVKICIEDCCCKLLPSVEEAIREGELSFAALVEKCKEYEALLEKMERERGEEEEESSSAAEEE